jgi:hypothetical protein
VKVITILFHKCCQEETENKITKQRDVDTGQAKKIFLKVKMSFPRILQFEKQFDHYLQP